VRIPRPRGRLAALALALIAGLAVAAPALAITPTITEFSSGLSAFADPTTLTVGPDGNLWLGEAQSPGRIAKITPQGTITEVATGGTTPGFSSNPQINGIVKGPDGNLWFTEGHNPGRVGWINPTTGTVLEPATGGGTPGFSVNSGPQEIASGPDGSLWFVEVGGPNAAIARITTAGTVTEFTSGLTANGEPAGITPVAAADGNLWFAEIKNGANKIGRINPATGAITEFSNGLNPSGDLRDIVPGPGGDVWFAQSADPGQIGRIAPDGTITEVASGGVTPGFTANLKPYGIAEGPDGAVWFTEPNTPSGPAGIGRLDPATGTVQEFSAPTADSAPLQIVEGPDGNMWFVEAAADRVARITTPPAASTTAATNVTATSATITGTADGHAQPTSFHIDYAPVGGALASTAEQPLGTSSVSGALTGLEQGTSYQARIVVTNPTGTTVGGFVGFKTGTRTPVVSGARESARRWREGKALPRISRKHRIPVGTTITFKLDQTAQVRFNFQDFQTGRRDIGGCAPTSRRNRRRPKCKRRVMVAALFFNGHPGVNKVRLAGRVSRRRRLKPRAYVLAINAYNSAGVGSKTVRLRFTIVK